MASAVDEFIARADEEHTQLVVACAHDFAEVRDALQDAGERGSAEARGIYLAVTTGDLVSLTSTYAWWVDQNLYAVPQVLSAPAGTWLGDPRLENEIRARLARAVGQLTDSGLSEETELTGALLQALSQAFESPAPLPQSVGLEPPVVLSVTSTNSRTHEPIFGADLGVILEIDLPKMRTTVGHLVQIKQALNRDASAEAPKWLISGSQLDDVLGHDPTATYWLFAQHSRPPVLSVAAKVLRARLGDNESVTIQYDHVRSAAVPVEQELADFFLGLWIGSDTPEAVKIARGEDSRHTPQRILTLRLRQGG